MGAELREKWYDFYCANHSEQTLLDPRQHLHYVVHRTSCSNAKNTTTKSHSPETLPSLSNNLAFKEPRSEQIGRVLEVLKANKVFFDTPCTDETVENADTAGLVVGTAGPGTTEGLLANNGTRALFIVIDVASRIAQTIGGCDEGMTVGCEAMDRR